MFIYLIIIWLTNNNQNIRSQKSNGYLVLNTASFREPRKRNLVHMACMATRSNNIFHICHRGQERKNTNYKIIFRLFSDFTAPPLRKRLNFQKKVHKNVTILLLWICHIWFELIFYNKQHSSFETSQNCYSLGLIGIKRVFLTFLAYLHTCWKDQQKYMKKL